MQPSLKTSGLVRIVPLSHGDKPHDGAAQTVSAEGD